jgi:hypothetical protein
MTFRTNTPVCETGKWRVSINDGTQPVCRAIGVSRSHVIRNAASVVRAMRMAEKLDGLLATPASDLEEFARVNWLKEKLQ